MVFSLVFVEKEHDDEWRDDVEQLCLEVRGAGVGVVCRYYCSRDSENWAGAKALKLSARDTVGRLERRLGDEMNGIKRKNFTCKSRLRDVGVVGYSRMR